MQEARSTDYYEVVNSGLLHDRSRPKRRSALERRDDAVGPWCYLAKVGRGTIRLSAVEYRILMFLAAHPYHAFSRRCIAAAVSTQANPVPVEKLSRYVQSLRRQLGFYADLVQSVPYIGYRFKA